MTNLLTVARRGAMSAATRGVVAQRRFARCRPDGFHDRLGPETGVVHLWYLGTWVGYTGLVLCLCNAVSAFEVENPWEHLWCQVPRGGLGKTMMST